MAVTPTINHYAGEGDGSLKEITWELTTGDPTGLAISFPEWSDKSWTFHGTIGSAVGAIQGAGANLEADFATMAKVEGGLAFTVNALPDEGVAISNPLFMRPKLTTPGSGAAWTVKCYARRPNQMRQ